MQYLSDAEQSDFVRWMESPGQEWTATADPIDCQIAWRRKTGRLREQPPRARRYRMPTGVRVDVGPLMDEKEWDWHEKR